MIQFLCHNVQSCMCCYCMRELDPNHKPQSTTLEHIIPQTASKDDLAPYFALGYTGLDARHIEHREQFLRTRHKPNVKIPHPHDVAYHNFAVSCDGAFLPGIQGGSCCNLARGNEFIDPIFLDPNAQQRLTYTEDGLVMPTIDTDVAASRFIQKAKLNAQRLREIRSLWYKLSITPLSQILAIKTSRDKRTLLLSVLFQDGSKLGLSRDDAILKNFSNESYWDTLMEYKWFHSYYSVHHP